MANVRLRLAAAFVAFALLLWLWPNLVHEPTHLLALRLQGAQGSINFDFNFPPRPSITLVGQHPLGLAGGLFFLLAPSLLSLAILGLCWFSRGRAALLTHVVLPIYLTFDLLINVGKSWLPTSDFRFLQAIPGLGFALLVTIFLYGAFITYTGLKGWGSRSLG